MNKREKQGKSMHPAVIKKQKKQKICIKNQSQPIRQQPLLNNKKQTANDHIGYKAKPRAMFAYKEPLPKNEYLLPCSMEKKLCECASGQ